MLSIKKLTELLEYVKKTRPELFKRPSTLNRYGIIGAMYEKWEYENIIKKMSKFEREEYFSIPNLDVFSSIEKFVNNLNNVYCVYIWYIKITDGLVPFYVGKGTKRRAGQASGRSEEFIQIFNKFDCEYNIVKENLSNLEALKLENELINMFREKGVPLVNKTTPKSTKAIL